MKLSSPLAFALARSLGEEPSFLGQKSPDFDFGGTQNYINESEALDGIFYTKRGTASVVANNRTAPDGAQTMDTATLGIIGVNDILVFVNDGGAITATPAARCEPSFWIQKVSGTATQLDFRNPQGGTSGYWQINLELLGTGLERIKRTHPAVTIVNEFVESAGPGLWFGTAEGTLVAGLWGMQLVPGTDPKPYAPTTGSIRP